ncbi:MAG: hypothetical protein DMG67_14455, partial [Acidobacteria bacterium]
MNEAYKFDDPVAKKLCLDLEVATFSAASGSAIREQESRLPVLEPIPVAMRGDFVDTAEILDRKTCEPLPALPLAAELSFYSQYSWCLNAFPTLSEVVDHLARELNKLDQMSNEAWEGWQRSEVITNIFLLSCAITDTIDDYLLGNIYDFSRISKVLPFAGAGTRALKKLFDGADRLRAASFSRLLRWRQTWATAATEFLKHSFIAGDLNGARLLEQRNCLTSLLPPKFSQSLWKCRPKIPAFFRSRDFAPQDCIELGKKFVAIFPERERPAIVIGLRTAGSYLAPLLCAYLRDRQQDTDWIAVRPRKGLALWELEALRQAARKKSRALIVDESIHSGQTLAQTVELLRQAGFSDEDIVVLNPVEPAFPRWRSSQTFESLRKINIITLEPEERYKQRLLDSNAVQGLFNEYFKARGYAASRIVAIHNPKIKELNQKWQTEAPERVDVRLKRVYEVHLSRASGDDEVRYVLAKSVGCGWLGYHAFIAGQKLGDFVPPMVGLRDGILYTEWISETEHSQPLTQNREEFISSIVSYVTARARSLRLSNDPTPDLATEGRHKGFEILASSLSRAYGSRIVAALKRPRIQRQLSQQCEISVMTDSKMSPEEWLAVGSRFLKADFEHHCHGKNELGMTDPAFDLAGAIFHFGLSDEESAQFIHRYIRESGDAGVEER